MGKENHYDCIYCFINKINNKKYIGQTSNLNRRISEHKYRSGKDNLPFHNAIMKYGIKSFEIKILIENVSTQEKLNEYEKFFIKRYKTGSKKFGYNISSGGSNGNVFKYMSENELLELKKKRSESSKEFWSKKSKEERKEINKKISKANKGRPKTDEEKRKISDTLKRLYSEGKITPHNKGIKKEQPIKTKKERCVVRYNEITKEYKFYNKTSLCRDEGFDISSINKCIRGILKHSYGYKWFLVDDFVNFLLNEEVELCEGNSQQQY